MRLRLVVAAWVSVSLAAVICGGYDRGWAETAPAPAASAPAEPPLTKEEKEDAETGKKAAAAIEKQLKVIEYYSAPTLEQVVDRLRPVTEKPHQKYTLKVVDEKAINAFSLPGGYIYFTKGLLQAVESEDELAAVAAHEMAHVCLSHSRKMESRDDKYKKILLPAVLMAVMSKNSGVDPGSVMLFGTLIKTNSLSQWGQEAELEADRAAVRYLQASKTYNPVAMLTVVEGLARMDKNGPEQEAGVFQTHPYAADRVVAVQKLLQDMHVPIERPRVRKGIIARATSVEKAGKEIGELRLDDFLVFQPAAEVEGVSPLARAQQSADLLNPLLLQELAAMDVSSLARNGAVLIQARGATVFKITPADAAFHQTTVDALAAQAMKAMRAAFYADSTRRAY